MEKAATNATTSPRIIQKDCQVIKEIDMKETVVDPITTKMGMKLKKELQMIYSKIQQNREDLVQKKIIEKVEVKDTQPKHKKSNSGFKDYRPSTAAKEIIKNATRFNIMSPTPKKDPPCFRRLAFGIKPIAENPYFPKSTPIQEMQTKPTEKLLEDKAALLRDYEIGNKIGEGAYATVREGIKKKTKEKVAIKIYERKRLKNTNRDRGIEREIKILKKMKNEGIVNFYGAYSTPNHVTNISVENIRFMSLWNSFPEII